MNEITELREQINKVQTALLTTPTPSLPTPIKPDKERAKIRAVAVAEAKLEQEIGVLREKTKQLASQGTTSLDLREIPPRATDQSVANLKIFCKLCSYRNESSSTSLH